MRFGKITMALKRSNLEKVAVFFTLITGGVGAVFAFLPGELKAQEVQTELGKPLATEFTYQGRLTDGGVAANGAYDFHFALYDDGTGGAQVGSVVVRDDIPVVDGLFSAVVDFGDVFDGTSLFLEISVRPGSENGNHTQLLPRQALLPALHARNSVSSLALQGYAVSDAAPATGEILEWDGTQWAPKSNRTLPQNCAIDQIIKWNGNAWVCADDQGSALVARVAALEDLLVHVSRTDGDLFITGANLHVVNGLAGTESINGLGNLIIGYNELRPADNDRTGSHVLVVGSQNNYSSYGGIVVGRLHTISGAYASVSGGAENSASGDFASISGGIFNAASGSFASVSGGLSNTASGENASVSGGSGNSAGGDMASVSGGTGNAASGERASISAGGSNTASGLLASVSGGDSNTASGRSASVSGGQSNTSSGDYASVSGGGNNKAIYTFTSVSGGDGNTAGQVGQLNKGEYASVSGGFNNRAIGPRSAISGGSENVADGSKSSVSGGQARFAAGTFDWRAGTLFEDD